MFAVKQSYVFLKDTESKKLFRAMFQIAVRFRASFGDRTCHC